MFEEEAKKRAELLKENQTLGIYYNDEDYERDRGWNDGEVSGYEDGFIDGAEFGYNKANEWHKVADGDLPKGENIHRDIYLKDRYGNLYTGNFFPKDKCHAEDCFAVEFLDWGFQGSQFCKKEQISEWCEISKEEIK